jgi:DNA processing protein
VIHDAREIAEFAKRGITVIRRGDENYPARLENLHIPPPVLYCRGDISLLNRPAVAIVGTRVCTRYGLDVAHDFAKTFAQNGIVVVSGLADGIDTAAHNGAFAGGGGTIAVLGNGIDVYYPVFNKSLQDKIGKRGLLVSEFLPTFRGSKSSFPQRNRIVAGLARALVIVEADLKSGTMITKDFALDLGIDVFAVPGSIQNPQSRGTNDLIKQAACAIATEPADVLAVFGGARATRGNSTEPAVMQFTFEEKQILDVLRRDEVHIDELVEKIAMPVPRLASILTEMEMRGLIQKIAGNKFVSNI